MSNLPSKSMIFTNLPSIPSTSSRIFFSQSLFWILSANIPSKRVSNLPSKSMIFTNLPSNSSSLFCKLVTVVGRFLISSLKSAKTCPLNSSFFNKSDAIVSLMLLNLLLTLSMVAYVLLSWFISLARAAVSSLIF